MHAFLCLCEYMCVCVLNAYVCVHVSVYVCTRMRACVCVCVFSQHLFSILWALGDVYQSCMCAKNIFSNYDDCDKNVSYSLTSLSTGACDRWLIIIITFIIKTNIYIY